MLKAEAGGPSLTPRYLKTEDMRGERSVIRLAFHNMIVIIPFLLI